jgi:hypothetical protein
VETTREGRTEKPEASSSSSSSLRRDQAGEVEPGAGGGRAGGAVVVPAPEVGVGVDAGAVVASGAGGTVSEASAAEICSVIARR